MTARNHHYVPQCYLRGFTTAGQRQSKLTVLDASTGKKFDTLPRNVAAKRDFNTIEIPGVDPLAIENAISTFESEVAPALKRIDAKCDISSPDDFLPLMNLISLMATHHPRVRSILDNFEQDIIKKTLQLVTQNKDQANDLLQQVGGSQLSDEDFSLVRTLIDEDKINIDIANDHHIESEFLMQDTILPFLVKRRWHTITSVTDTGFITSDHPVGLFWSDDRRDASPYSPGFGLEQTTVIFPVSRKVLIVGKFEDDDYPLATHGIREAHFNSITASNCLNQVYSANDQFHFLTKSYQLGIGTQLFEQRFFNKRLIKA